MEKPFKVITRDVDGTNTRSFKNFETAKKRFEDMSGHKLPVGISSVRDVSDYGTVVIFESSIDLSHMKPTNPAAGMTDAEIFANWRNLWDQYESMPEYLDENDTYQVMQYLDINAAIDAFRPAFEAASEREEQRQREREQEIIRLGLDDMRYGGEMHQMYGDAWLYQDCPGAW